jgi:hypothetical protein
VPPSRGIQTKQSSGKVMVLERRDAVVEECVKKWLLACEMCVDEADGLAKSIGGVGIQHDISVSQIKCAFDRHLEGFLQSGRHVCVAKRKYETTFTLWLSNRKSVSL